MHGEQYCLECFARIPLEVASCPACGHATGGDDRTRFPERLVHALQHPLSEVRMRAIVALGWRASEDASQALADCALRRPVDVNESLAVVTALAQLSAGPRRAAALRRLAASHAARAVRAAAVQALGADGIGTPVARGRLRTRLDDARAQAVDYLRRHQSASGGFCYYQTDDLQEPNLADTYYAVKALAALGEPVPRSDDVGRFVAGFADSRQPDQLYAVVMTRRRLDAACGFDDLAGRIAALPVSNTHPSGASTAAWLRRVRHVVRLQQLLGGPRDGARIAEHVAALGCAGGFGDHPNLEDTGSALEILDACAALAPATDSAGFVDARQDATTGFTSMAGSRLTNLESVRAGVSSCRLLGLVLRHPEAALRYVLACQCSGGGFARVPGALPGIESTCRAAEVLAAFVR